MTKAFSQNLTEVRQAPATPKDDITLFTEHIAMQLRAVKDPQQVAIMQNSIENALFQCRMKFWGNPTGMSMNQIDKHVADGPTIGQAPNPLPLPASVPRAKPSSTFVPSQSNQSSAGVFTDRRPSTQGHKKQSGGNTHEVDDDSVQEDSNCEGILVLPTISTNKKGASSVPRKRKSVGMSSRTTRMTLRQKAPLDLDEPVNVPDQSEHEELPDI
jgi:hypothetical protein